MLKVYLIIKSMCKVKCITLIIAHHRYMCVCALNLSIWDETNFNNKAYATCVAEDTSQKCRGYSGGGASHVRVSKYGTSTSGIADTT